MCYRIAISSFAAAVIGMSCIVTDASARGGGGGGGGGGGRSGGPALGFIGGPAGGGATGFTGRGPAGFTGGGAAAGARYYAPASNKSGGTARSGVTAPGVRWTGSTGSFPGGTTGGGGRVVIPRIGPTGGFTGTTASSTSGNGSWESPQIGVLQAPAGGGPAGAHDGGAVVVPGSDVAAGARYYAPASYDSNAACGRYPYPPCNAVCGRYPYPRCKKVPTQ
jgi:hypothetical protein